MFRNFANSYFMKPYWVFPSDGDNKININEYLYIRNKIYKNNNSIIMKLDSTHFEVKGDERVLPQTIHVNKNHISQTSKKQGREAQKRPILLAKPKISSTFSDVQINSKINLEMLFK